MKKTFLLAAVIASFSFGYAQSTKQGGIHNAGANDPKVLELIRARQKEAPIKDCGDEHLGKLVFHNKTTKFANYELYPTGNPSSVIQLAVPAGESVYVNDLLVGEYKYKKTGSKKAKKKDFVNVMECTLKIVLIDK